MSAHIHKHTDTHAHIHTHTYTLSHAHIHTHTDTHAYTHTCMDTHTCTLDKSLTNFATSKNEDATEWNHISRMHKILKINTEPIQGRLRSDRICKQSTMDI